MFKESYKKLKRALLLLLVFALGALLSFCPSWLSQARAFTESDQGLYRSFDTHAQIIPLGSSTSVLTDGSKHRGRASPSPDHDLVLQVQGNPDARTAPTEDDGDASIWLTLLIIFLAGLALNLTPCVYPLIPITVSYFGGKGEGIRGHTIIHGILYTVGLATTNSLLGLSAALSGGMLGAVLQHPVVLIFVAGVMVAMALSFFGLWEIRLPLGFTRLASKSYAGFLGTFFMGLTLGVVAAPCLGPFILGLLIYVGQTGDPLLGFLYFFVLSLGLGIPLALLGIFSGALARIPKSGDWMLWIRKLMGWVLVLMAAYMVGPVVPHAFVKPLLLALVAVAGGIHLGWLDKTGSGLRVFPYLKKIAGIALVCGGVAYLIITTRPVGKVEWVPYDQAVIARAAEEKKPLIIDFYADWCAPCRIMDKQVFSDPEVIKLSRSVTAMRLDLTRWQPFHDEAMEKYEIRGIPTAVFINRQGVEEKNLKAIGFVGKDEFLKRLKLLLENSPSS